MATTVRFENPPGEVLNYRNFSPGQPLRIAGNMVGPLALGEPFQSIRLEIYADNNEFSPIFLEERTTIWGNFAFDIILPWATARASVRIVSTFSASGQDIIDIPISIGDVNPGPAPDIPGTTPTPRDEGPSPLQFKLGMGAIALIALAAIILLAKK